MSWYSRCARPRRRGERVVREHMVNAAALSVPLRVDIGSGANWDEAH